MLHFANTSRLPLASCFLLRGLLRCCKWSTHALPIQRTLLSLITVRRRSIELSLSDTTHNRQRILLIRLQQCSVCSPLRLARTLASAAVSCHCRLEVLSHANAVSIYNVRACQRFCLTLTPTDKLCTHTLLALLHMQMSGHSAFKAAAATLKKPEKEEKGESECQLDSAHRKAAEYLLENCRLREESADLRRLLNRALPPGDCPLGVSCPSRGSSKTAQGHPRGSRSCDHTFLSELHVCLERCPNCSERQCVNLLQ